MWYASGEGARGLEVLYLDHNGEVSHSSVWPSYAERQHPELVQQGIAPPLSVYRENLSRQSGLIYEGMWKAELLAFIGPPDRETNMAEAMRAALQQPFTIAVGDIEGTTSAHRRTWMWSYVMDRRQFRLEVDESKVSKVIGWF